MANKSKFKIFFKSIIIPLLVGGIIGLLITKSIDYNYLNKPFLAPPSYIFPIVWSILYLLMGISYGILDYSSNVDSNINFIYYSQLFVNALWSIFFFLLKWRLFSFIWILLLIALILKMISIFYKKNKISSYIQIPYLLWTIFAGYLNISIYFLNK